MFNAPRTSFFAAIAAAAALSLVAAPAMAASKDNQPKLRLKVEKRKNGETVYCTSRMITGSIMPQKTCLTKEGWQEQGVQVTPEGTADAGSQKTPS